jgi:cytochrome o ubiquinol oxidase subunit 2
VKILRAALAAPLLAGLAGCKMVVMDPSGDVAAQQRDLILLSTGLMLLIIVPVIALTLFFAWKYRASNTKATYTPDWHHSTRLEMVIWAAPLAIIMVLGTVTWITSHTLDPYRPLRRVAANRPVAANVKPLEVDVVALDWKWLFIYPDQGVATVNQLVVPVGTPVNFKLTSATVWNTFFVPQMGSMIYTMPRMATRLNLEADKEGVFPGRSAHFSGDGFPGMEFNVLSVSPQQFAAWTAGARGAGQVLDARSYAQLAKPSSYVRPMTYSNVQPGLFEAIVSGRPPPTPQLPHNPQAEGPAG